MVRYRVMFGTCGVLVGATILSAILLATSTTSANNTDSNISVTIPTSCNITSTIDSAHNATITNGTYKEDIGTTTFKTFCNDNDGYSVYAIGYSGAEYGNTNMLATIGGILDPNHNIATGLATSGNTSSWSMKLIPTPGTYQPTILSDTNGSFSNYHIIPNTYTKVATFLTNTDFTIGSEFKTTYRVYIQPNQPAGTYQGKVKYTLVHPASAKPKDDPRFVANLDTGSNINVKMKNLANNTTNATINTQDTKITTIARADSLPVGFTPSTANTITTSTSAQPVYIFFDDTSGTMYYYSEANDIILNPDSSNMFRNLALLTNIDALADWDTSSVTNMDYMFYFASSLTNIDGASKWNTSSVTNMAYMFYPASSLTNIDALSNWNTSSVTNMRSMFSFASSLTNINGARNWDTGNLTNIENMFRSVPYIDATVLNNWNVAKVTNKNNAFSNSVAKQPCWYNNTPCPNNSNNTGGSTNNVSPYSNTAPAGSPSYSYSNSGAANGSESTQEDDSDAGASNNNLEKVSPQGKIYHNDNQVTFLLFIISLIISTFLFLILHNRRYEEEEEDNQTVI